MSQSNSMHQSGFELVAPEEAFVGLRKTWQQVESMVTTQKDEKSHLQTQTQSRKRELEIGQGHKLSHSAPVTHFL